MANARSVARATRTRAPGTGPTSKIVPDACAWIHKPESCSRMAPYSTSNAESTTTTGSGSLTDKTIRRYDGGAAGLLSPHAGRPPTPCGLPSTALGRWACSARRMSGLSRSRPPLALLLYLAGQDGLLVWHGPDAFGVLAPPAGSGYPVPGGTRRVRWLRLLDRRWGLLVFGVPPAVLLTGAALLLLFPPAWLVAAGLAVAAGLYVTVLMTACTVTGIWRAYRRAETAAAVPSAVRLPVQRCC